MITASVAEEDVIAVANGPGYPRFFMAGIMIDPRAATSATAEPEISAKNMAVTTFTIASPPRMNPISAEAKAISRREMLDVFIRPPAKMNNGIARRGKGVAPPYMTRATLASASGPCSRKIATVATAAKAIAMGTLAITRTTRPTNIISEIMMPPLPPRRSAH